MRILFLPAYHGEETSERTPQYIAILKKKHELVFLNPKEYWIKKRGLWPLRAWERFQVTQSLIREGKKERNLDLIFCRDFMNALPGTWIARFLNRPCLWDSEGSLKDFWETTHKYPTQVLPWMSLEGWLTKRVDSLITVTENDRQAYIRQGMDPERISIIPICVRPERCSQKSKKEARKSLGLPAEETLFLFFSMFDYLPNRAALHFLNEEVAPHLPGRLLLCGKGKLPKKLHPKVHYLGFLPIQTLYDLIRAADIGLAPIWEANGTLTKVLDMLAHGAPTVITPPIHRGIPELEDGIHTLVAQSKGEFLEKTLLLSKNPPLQEGMRSVGPEVIHKKYDWSLYEDKLLDLIDAVARRKN